MHNCSSTSLSTPGKSLWFRWPLLLLLAFASSSLSAQSLYVASYNIRYQNDDDAREGNGWQQRAPVVCGQLLFEHPDIFGAQEVLHGQLQDMLRLMPDYDYIGVGRDDGAKKGEYAPIFYDRQKLRLLRHGHFWLSETPDKPSLGWDAACMRICTWGEFAGHGKQGIVREPFFFFNLHMDHIGVVARREAARLVISRIRELAGKKPVILTGDFNVDQHNEIYAIFSTSGVLVDSYTAARIRFAENGTFNAYHQERKTASRIDHVFVSPAFQVDRYGILTNTYWQQQGDSISRHLPSDHYPVFVHLNK